MRVKELVGEPVEADVEAVELEHQPQRLFRHRLAPASTHLDARAQDRRWKVKGER